MKTSAQLLLVIGTLLGFSACNPDFEAPLCDGRPAYDLSALAGRYVYAVSTEVKNGKVERTSDNRNEARPLDVVAKNGRLVIDKVEYRGCRIEPSIWIEEMTPANRGAKLLSADANQVVLQMEGFSTELLRRNGVAFEQPPARPLPAFSLLIKNKGVDAAKILSTLDPDNYATLTLLK